MTQNLSRIELSKKEDIIVNTDKEGKKYTNESIFEFLINRKSQVAPDGMENVMQFVGTNGFNEMPPGAFEPPIGNFDVAKACVWITRNSYARYIKGVCGQCAKFVRLALEAGGINTNGHPISAYQYAGFLPKIGFKFVTELSSLESQKQFTAYMAKPGDIAVMPHEQHGHICMYNGSQWVSDFKQNNMWVYSGVGKCRIFRYTKA